MPADPYADPETGVLRNKLGLSTAAELGNRTWAGQIRTVAISKRSMFCLPQHIESSATEIFRALHGENLLRSLKRDAFIDRLAHYLGEINALHPFRDGNGRTQRALVEQLASDAGFSLDWQGLDADRNIAASAAIMRGDPVPMRTMLGELVRSP